MNGEWGRKGVEEEKEPVGMAKDFYFQIPVIYRVGVPEKTSHFQIRITQDVFSLKTKLIYFGKAEACSHLAG